MPFTFAHPAIILPLRYSQKFSLTALIVGALMPDFEYFLRMRLYGIWAHSFEGLLFFCLPIGLMITYIFHYLIKNALIKNLPLFLKQRLYFITTIDWHNYVKTHFIIVIYSLIIGAFSHIFWDSFTHESGFFVQEIKILQETILNQPVYKIAQRVSSLLGLIIVFIAIILLPKTKIPQTKINLNYWFYTILITIIITVMRFYLSPNLLKTGHIIVTIIMALLIAITIVPIITKNK